MEGEALLSRSLTKRHFGLASIAFDMLDLDAFPTFKPLTAEPLNLAFMFSFFLKSLETRGMAKKC